MRLIKTETDPATGYTTLTYKHYEGTFRACPTFIRDAHVMYGLDILSYAETAINKMINLMNKAGKLEEFRIGVRLTMECPTMDSIKTGVEIYRIIENPTPSKQQSVGFSIDDE